MKKRFVYLLSCIVLITGLASCSDDDSDDNVLPLSVSIVNGDKQDIALGNTLVLEAKVENGEKCP